MTDERLTPVGVFRDIPTEEDKEREKELRPVGVFKDIPIPPDTRTSRLEDLGRFGGQMLRGPVAGMLEMGAFGYDAIGQAANAVTGNRLGYQPIGPTAEAAIDELGIFPPAPTPEDRSYIPYQASKFAGGGGAVVGMGKMFPKLAPLAEAPLAQIVGEALAGGASAGAEQLGLGDAAQVAAGIGAGLTPFGIQGVARRYGSDVPAAERARRLEQMQKYGFPPTPGQVAGGGFARAETRALDRDGAYKMRDVIDQQDRVIDNLVSTQADRLGPNVSRAQTSAAIETGLESWMQRSQQEGDALYQQFESMVRQDAPTALRNTLGDGPLAPLAGEGRNVKTLLRGEGINKLREAFGDDIAQYVERLNLNGTQLLGDANVLPLQDIREIRSLVGQQIESGIFSNANVDQKNFRRLYAALSKDIEEGALAAASNNPEAVALFNKANAYWRDRADQIEKIGSVLGKHGGGDNVYRKLVNASTEGASVLTDIFKSLTPAERNLFRGTFLREMAKATPGKQHMDRLNSLQTYLTNYNRMAPEVRALLLESTPELRDATEFVARVASTRRKAFEEAGNTSKTARMLGASQRTMATVGAAATGNIGAAAAIAGIPVGHNVLDRVVTNPRFMSWLAKQGDLPPQAMFNSLMSLQQIGIEMEEQDLVDFANEATEYLTEKR